MTSDNIADLEIVRTGNADKPDFWFGSFKFFMPSMFLSENITPRRDEGYTTADIVQMNREFLQSIGSNIITFDGSSFWLQMKVYKYCLTMFFNQVKEYEEAIRGVPGEHTPIICIANCLIQCQRVLGLGG